MMCRQVAKGWIGIKGSWEEGFIPPLLTSGVLIPDVSQGVSWMWGDTNRLARKNPARWSSAKSASETITELEGYAHKARPVLVAIPGEDYHECASVSVAIEYLEKRWMIFQ